MPITPDCGSGRDDGFDGAYRTGRAMRIDDALVLASRLQ